MAFNGSGVFSRLYNWTNDANASININSGRMDGEDNGFATGLSTCITKDGQTTITANLPMAGFKHTGVGDATLVNHYASAGQVESGSLNLCADSAGTDTITTTAAITLTAYTKGQTFRFKLGGTNTGAVTLNIDGLGAKAIQKLGAALVAGDLTTGDSIQVFYDGTAFQLQTPTRTAVITAGSIATAAIANDAVTYAKLQNVSATSRILGRKTAAAGDAEECTLSEVLDFVGSAAWGDILFRGTAGWQRLAASTAGFFLKTNGAGADPSYAAVANGLVFLSSQTASNSAALNFTSLISSTYDKYLLEFDDFDIGSTAVDILIQVSTDNGSNWKTTGYITNTGSIYSGGPNYGAQTTGIGLNGGQVKNTVPASGQIYFSNPNSTTKLCIFNGVATSYNNTSSIVATGVVQGYYNTTGTAINAVRILLSSGNIVSGIARLYGLQKS